MSSLVRRSFVGVVAGVLLATLSVAVPVAAQVDEFADCPVEDFEGLTVRDGSPGVDKMVGVAGVAELFLLGAGDDEVIDLGDGDVACLGDGKDKAVATGVGTVVVFAGDGEDVVEFKDSVGGNVDLATGKGTLKSNSGDLSVTGGAGEKQLDLGEGSHTIVLTAPGKVDVKTAKAGSDSVTIIGASNKCSTCSWSQKA